MATSYTLDQTWVRPFTPIVKEPSVLSTSPLVIIPRENISPKTKIYTFEFPTMSEYFLNLNSIQLFVKGQLMHDDLTVLDDGEKVYLSNAPIYSLFTSVNLTFGENQEKIVYNDYPYLSLFQLCDKTTDNSRRMLMSGYIPDDGSTGRASIRQSLVKGSQETMFMGKIYADILSIDSFLLKNTPLSLQLVKAHQNFYTCAEDESKDYNFVIKQIEIHIDRIHPNPKLTDALEMTLKNTDAIYNFDHLILKKFHIPDNVYNYNLNRLWSGKLPRRFAFSTVSQNSYQGSKAEEPMELLMTNISKFKLKVNEIDLETIDLKQPSYVSYHKMLQFLQAGDHTFITKGIFDKSLTFLCFDLNVLCANNMSCINELAPSGCLSVEITFKTNNVHPLILMMYAFNDAELRIDSKRKCTITTNHS